MKWLYYPGRLSQPTDYLSLPTYGATSDLRCLMDVTLGVFYARLSHVGGPAPLVPSTFGMAAAAVRFLWEGCPGTCGSRSY